MGLLIVFCMFCGALVGVHAAQRRGFSMVGGVLGGAFLGLLSPLLYLVSGTGRKCPHCAEWVQSAAVVCRHCHRDLYVVTTR